jgi:hypothetical protein
LEPSKVWWLEESSAFARQHSQITGNYVFLSRNKVVVLFCIVIVIIVVCVSFGVSICFLQISVTQFYLQIYDKAVLDTWMLFVRTMTVALLPVLMNVRYSL